MRNDLQRHKKSDKVKWIITAIGFILVAVMLTGICLQVFGKGKAKPSEWFTKPVCEHVYVDGKCDKCGEVEKPAEDNNEENKGGEVTPAA